MGRLLILTTIHASLASYVLAVTCWLTRRQDDRYRAWWTAGCIFMWVHAACAFHFYHGWSHAAAVNDTALQTQKILGWPFGAGIWFSYALLVAWLADVLTLWFSTRQTIQAQRTRVALHAYTFFILFNGTVVFAEGLIRWLGMLATCWFIWLSWRYCRQCEVNSFDEQNINND